MASATHLQRLVAQGAWEELPQELLAKVLLALQAAGPSAIPEVEGLGFAQVSAIVRLVCSAWKGAHDASVTRLQVRQESTEEAMGLLVRLFPAAVAINLSGCGIVTDEGLRTVDSLSPQPQARALR